MSWLFTAVIVAFAAALIFISGRDVRRVQALLARQRHDLRALEERVEAAEGQRAIHLAILNGVGEGVLALDDDRRVVLANQRFLELFDIEDAVIGKTLGEVVRIAAVFEGVDRALARKESIERFVRGGRRIEMRALPISAREIAVVAIFIDVTQIEHLEQVRRNFLSDFSHEVRTPLAGLRSAVETYETHEHLTDEEEKQLRRIVSRQLRRLERLVDDLSELSRIESGEVALDRHEVDLRGLISEVCEDFAERAAQHRVRFSISGDSSIVYADPVRMEQALSNLIDNAIKYGGDDREVRIEVRDSSDFGTVRITDQGDGIPPADREKIFHRFYRVDKSRSQEVAGTGLGLAITKHLVLRHGGTIDVESAPGEGATFVVKLPKR